MQMIAITQMSPMFSQHHDNNDDRDEGEQDGDDYADEKVCLTFWTLGHALARPLWIREGIRGVRALLLEILDPGLGLEIFGAREVGVLGRVGEPF